MMSQPALTSKEKREIPRPRQAGRQAGRQADRQAGDSISAKGYENEYDGGGGEG
jgi:hypothetical protein